MKNKLQQAISATDGEHQLQSVSGKFKIKTTLKKIFNTISFKLRTTYIYYYYLCLKDFIVKLLNPKKMMIVKWRIDPTKDFMFYTEIPENLIYHTSPIFYQGEYNQDGCIYDFELDNERKRYQPIESFRIITNNNGVDYIYTKNETYNRIIKDCEILKWYENNIEVPFDRNNIIGRNTKCIFDYIENLAVPLEGNFEIANDISNLHRIEYDSFMRNFRIK